MKKAKKRKKVKVITGKRDPKQRSLVRNVHVAMISYSNLRRSAVKCPAPSASNE